MFQYFIPYFTSSFNHQQLNMTKYALQGIIPQQNLCNPTIYIMLGWVLKVIRI